MESDAQLPAEAAACPQFEHGWKMAKVFQGLSWLEDQEARQDSCPQALADAPASSRCDWQSGPWISTYWYTGWQANYFCPNIIGSRATYINISPPAAQVVHCARTSDGRSCASKRYRCRWGTPSCSRPTLDPTHTGTAHCTSVQTKVPQVWRKLAA